MIQRRTVRGPVLWSVLFVLVCPAVLPAARFDLNARREAHWAWQPIDPQTPPPVRLTGWPRQPTDQFLLARLEREGLTPAPPTDRAALLRRVHFDLIGLPPIPDEMERFLADVAPDAYERAVDRLLASPRFGERWARHWLDLVRYAETLGHEFDYPILNAWRYRDYIIRAFNSDLPYDQLVREHIAGDLLPEPRRHPEEGFNESIIGTGFYWLGQQVHSPVDVRLHQAETIDNQVDVLTKTFMALTVSCARCHDHKFDAISTRDFYALYGMLSSSRYAQRTLDPAETFLAPRRELERVKGSIRSGLAAAWATQAMQLDDVALLQAAQAVKASFEAIVHSTNDLADFTRSSFGDWRATDHGFGTRPATLDEFIITATDPPAIRLVEEQAAHSGLLSRSFEGSLRSPTVSIGARYLHIRAAGRGARFNIVIDNFTIIRDPIYGALRQRIDRDEFGWSTVDLKMWKGHRAYVEFNDMNTGDPGTSDYGTAGSIAISRVVLSEDRTPPAFSRVSIPPDILASPGKLRALTVESLNAWERGSGTLTPVQAGWLRHLLEGRVLSIPADASMDALFREYGGIRLPEPARAAGMVDGTGLDEPVFVRGDPHQPGDLVPRRFLEALGGAAAGKGSGRLELAERVLDTSNPFTARVMVNRVWHHLFGRGLVPTPDDFGVLGEPASHPELLDWLASHYRTEARWSTKRLIRLLVTSSAYRMSTRAEDPRAETVDPLNRLLHRMPIRRLEGETLRDALLFVAGELDPAMYGPSVPVHLTPFMEGRGRPSESGPLDGARRRSIYLEVRRNFLTPMMLAFDSPTPLTTIGQRTRSNVPAQALTLMNDPFVGRIAKSWAKRALQTPEASASERVRWLFQSAFARSPTEEEMGHAMAFVQADPGEETVWVDLCHVLFNAKEFVFIP